jgi:AraC-like DNA-binding protein
MVLVTVYLQLDQPSQLHGRPLALIKEELGRARAAPPWSRCPERAHRLSTATGFQYKKTTQFDRLSAVAHLPLAMVAKQAGFGSEECFRRGFRADSELSPRGYTNSNPGSNPGVLATRGHEPLMLLISF